MFTFHRLRHLRLYEPEDGPVGVPVVHLTEAATWNHERVRHQDQASLVLRHLGPDLATQLLPPRVDLGAKPTVV